MNFIRTIKLIARHPIASIKDFRTFGSVDAIEAINKQTTKYLGGFNDPNVKYEGPLFKAHVEETIKEWKKMGYDDEHIKYNIDTLMTDAKMTYGMKYQYEELKKIKNPIIRKEVEQLLKESSEAYGNEYRSLYDNKTNFDKERVLDSYKQEKFVREAYKAAEKAGGEYVAEDGSKFKILPNGNLNVTVDKVKKYTEMTNNPKEYFKAQKVASAAVAAKQSPASKGYNDTSSSSFKSKKSVYDSIPSTRSAGVMSRSSSPETFKNGVVNMARTMDASADQLTKLIKMDAKLLEELYFDKPFLFDLYFEYSLYDDFGSAHEDSGINKLIESYEYKYGVTL